MILCVCVSECACAYLCVCGTGNCVHRDSCMLQGSGALRSNIQDRAFNQMCSHAVVVALQL